MLLIDEISSFAVSASAFVELLGAERNFILVANLGRVKGVALLIVVVHQGEQRRMLVSLVEDSLHVEVRVQIVSRITLSALEEGKKQAIGEGFWNLRTLIGIGQ